MVRNSSSSRRVVTTAWLKAPNSIPPMRPTITLMGLKHARVGAPSWFKEFSEAFAAWALYYSKFASAYNAQNLTTLSFTVQNEPEFSSAV